jgi:hypothetical protein
MATDDFSIEEKVNLLIKQYFYKPSTKNTLKFFQEPATFRPNILTEQIWSNSSEIPLVAPSDLSTLLDTSLGDDSNVLFNTTTNLGNLEGKTSITDPYIKKYIKVPLIHVPGTGDVINDGIAFSSPLDGSGNRVLEDIIPFNYDEDGSYLYDLYDNDLNIIAFGKGSWVISEGYLTFYNKIEGLESFVVSPTQPPFISFYKYVGDKGLSIDTGGGTLSSVREVDNNSIVENVTDLTFNQNTSLRVSNPATGIAQIDLIPEKFAIGKAYSNTSLFSHETLQNNSLIIEGNVGIGISDPAYAVHVFGTIWSTCNPSGSDKRWKKNFKPLDNSLDKLSKINGYYYDWKTKEECNKENISFCNFSNDKQIGVIAQDIEEIYPELVSKDKNDFLSVSYDKLTVILIESVKEMNTKLKEQEIIINNYENRFKIIEDNLNII